MSKVTLSLMVVFLMAATSVAADISEVTLAGAQTVEVGMVRWLEDGSFETSVVKMPKKKFEEYLEKIKSCQTPEEGVAVLQEYDIVPEGRTLDDLRIALEAEILEVLPEGTTLDEFIEARRPRVPDPRDWCRGIACLVAGGVNAPIWNLHIPQVLYIWESYAGGWVTMCPFLDPCSCQNDNYNYGEILGFAGVFRLRQFWDDENRLYAGFALSIYVVCDW